MATNLSDLIVFSPAVAEAINDGTPIVALESTVITHGLPYPQNFNTLSHLESVLASEGVTPATIIVLEGKIHIGMTETEKQTLKRLAQTGDKQAVIKLSMSDLPLVLAKGGSGGTTVSATMLISAMSGIRFFATGGIGGVHRDWQNSLDISMDIEALASYPVVVISAGCKAILDVPATLEALESKAVPVWGWQTDRFPTFYTRSSDLPVEQIDTEEEFVTAFRHHLELFPQGTGVLIANPIPAEHEIAGEIIEPDIREAIAEAAERDVHGKDLTPFLLERLSQTTHGESIKANLALLENNVRLAAKLAKTYYGE